MQFRQIVGTYVSQNADGEHRDRGECASEADGSIVVGHDNFLPFYCCHQGRPFGKGWLYWIVESKVLSIRRHYPPSPFVAQRWQPI